MDLDPSPQGRCRKRPDALDLIERSNDRARTLAKAVVAHTCDARPRVDAENFFDKFALAEVDIDARDPWQLARVRHIMPGGFCEVRNFSPTR